jgi:hypothetical protein
MTSQALELAAPPPDKKAAALYTEQSTYQLLRWMTTLPDPDIVLQKAGIPRYRLRELEADDEIIQCLETRRDAVLGVPWHLEPSEDPASKYITAELEPIWDDLIRWAFEAVPYGYSVIELIYRQDGAKIGLASKANPVPDAVYPDRLVSTMGKPLEWFKPTVYGLRYFPDNGSGGAQGVQCDPLKYLLTVRGGSYRNPYGEALLSRLWWPVFFRRQGWSFWVRFLERFGTPILMGAVADPQGFIEAMREAGIETAIAVQMGENVTATLASGANEFETVERAIVSRIQKLILGQTLTSQIGPSGGSYAAAKVHDSVREDKRNSDTRLLRGTMQGLVDRLALLNGWKAPQVVMADDTGLEADRAERDSKLSPVLKDSRLRFSRDYFIDRYDLEDDDLEDAPEPPKTPPGANSPPDPGNPPPEPGTDDSTDLKALAGLLFRAKLAARGKPA